MGIVDSRCDEAFAAPVPSHFPSLSLTPFPSLEPLPFPSLPLNPFPSLPLPSLYIISPLRSIVPIVPQAPAGPAGPTAGALATMGSNLPPPLAAAAAAPPKAAAANPWQPSAVGAGPAAGACGCDAAQGPALRHASTDRPSFSTTTPARGMRAASPARLRAPRAASPGRR